jgi:hypothetical protein
MKLSIKNIFILSGLAVLLFACGKETEISVNSGTFRAIGQEINTVRLFTQSGEIKNSTAVSAFVNRYSYNGCFLSTTNATTYGITGSNLEFLSSGEAIYNYLSNVYPVNIISMGGILYLESKDTTELGVNISDNEANIYNKMLTYTPLYSDTIYSDSTFHTIKTKNCFYMTQNGAIIKFPRLNYVYIENQHSNAGKYINNLFNEKCLSMLNVSDTLAIQQTEILFMK